MLTYAQVNKIVEEKQTDLFNKNLAFFAFSDSQVEEARARLNIVDGTQLVSLGAGLIAPRSNVPAIAKGLKLIQAEKKLMIKEKLDMVKVILYELNNYECFYTGDISEAVEVLSAYGVTHDEVLAVYKKYRSK